MYLLKPNRLCRYALMAAIFIAAACKVESPPLPQLVVEPSSPEAPATAPPPTLTPLPTRTPPPTETPTITPTPQPVMITAQNADQLHLYRQLPAHTSTVYGAFWSPDGSMLVTTSQDGRVIIWDTATWEPRLLLEYGEGIYSWGYPWSPDGSLLASVPRESEYGDTLDQVLLWDTATGELVRTITLPFGGNAQAVGWSPDGRWFAIAAMYSVYQPVVLILDFESGELLRTLTVGEDWSLEWSPDGSWLATGNGGYGEYDNPARSIRNPFDGTLVRTITGPNDAVNWPEFSPDWSLLAFGMSDGSILLMDQQGQTVRTLDQARFSPGVIAWSPDGTLIGGVSDTDDGYRTTMVWDVETGQVLAALRNDQPTATIGLFGAGVAWSPDQTILLSFGGTDNGPTLWTVAP